MFSQITKESAQLFTSKALAGLSSILASAILRIIAGYAL
jgi:hypothetical protein